MKLFSLIVSVVFCIDTLAQNQTFDFTTFTPPAGWKKNISESTIQFTKEDNIKGTYCAISLFKAVPGTADSKKNFDATWETVVKELVTVSAAPQMQPVAKEDGWEAQTGYAQFESEGNKGLVMLVTSSGFEKMVNIIILTNTDVYEKNITDFLESVSFNKSVTKTNTNNKVAPPINKPVVTPVTTSGFTFSTTNFDDGWTSTVQEDWVEVTKGNVKVLLHYPKAGTIFPADPDPLTTAAWNILVAPRYSNLKNYKTSYINTYDRPYLGMGYATDNTSSKQVFILLFRQGSSGWLEFVTPDKNTFVQQYKFDPETIRWDSESDLLKPLAAMASYNKFAVAASDFKGAWTSDFTGVQQLYNVYSGQYAGMNINQSSQTFQFGAGNTYNWKILAVNGMVGAIKYGQAKSVGKFSIPNNWQIQFSDIEGKPKKYNAYFSCLKGARLLMLLDAQYPGSGIYTAFGQQ